jgi:hypothetical protein
MRQEDPILVLSTPVQVRRKPPLAIRLVQPDLERVGAARQILSQA